MKCNCEARAGPGLLPQELWAGAAPGEHEGSPPCSPGHCCSSWAAGHAAPENCNSAAHTTAGEAWGACCVFFLFFLNDAWCLKCSNTSQSQSSTLPTPAGSSAAPALPTAQDSTVASPEGRNASPTELPLDLLSSNTSHLNSFKAWSQQLFTPSTGAILQSPHGPTWTVNLFCL